MLQRKLKSSTSRPLFAEVARYLIVASIGTGSVSKASSYDRAQARGWWNAREIEIPLIGRIELPVMAVPGNSRFPVGRTAGKSCRRV